MIWLNIDPYLDLTYFIEHSILADDDPDRAAEDGAAAAAGARGAQDRPLLGVRRGRPRPPHGHVRPHRALARLHLVSGGCTSALL